MSTCTHGDKDRSFIVGRAGVWTCYRCSTHFPDSAAALAAGVGINVLGEPMTTPDDSLLAACAKAVAKTVSFPENRGLPVSPFYVEVARAVLRVARPILMEEAAKVLAEPKRADLSVHLGEMDNSEWLTAKSAISLMRQRILSIANAKPQEDG